MRNILNEIHSKSAMSDSDLIVFFPPGFIADSHLTSRHSTLQSNIKSKQSDDDWCALYLQQLYVPLPSVVASLCVCLCVSLQ